MNEPLILIPKLFGIGRHGIEVSNFDDSLDKALWDRHKFSTGWRKILHPRTYVIEGYHDPWKDSE